MHDLISKKLHFMAIFLMLTLCGCRNSAGNAEESLSALYASLDEEIGKADTYDAEKEKRIAELREEYRHTEEPRRRMEVLNRLAHEFNSYNADSAINYVEQNLRNPYVKEHDSERIRLMIHKADIFAHAGLFADALNTLDTLQRINKPEALLESYYATYCALYQYLSEYTYEHGVTHEYEKKRSLYADSLRMVTKPGSFNDHIYVMTEKARNGETDEAISNLKAELVKYQPGMREYSILASTLAYLYKTVGNAPEYRRNLAMSAISDVKGSVKENMSFREMATVMFEDGDVEHANNYLKKSIADANFYSALMRNAQSSKMLPIIDDAYAEQQHRMTTRLRVMMWCSILLSCFLIATVVLIRHQIKRVRTAKDNLAQANIELTNLSDRLKATVDELGEKNEALAAMNHELEKTNDQLADRNRELKESNRTKEQYAGLFMEYCSSSISSLQTYQKSLKVLASQGGGKVSLMKKLESSELSDEMLVKFYHLYDEAILQLYPDFVEKFNNLLLPEEKIVLKSGELLNTELRLYALIRMGIDDSAKISRFLRCSISTVYTYRSKMKKRAIHPDTFEEDVKGI